MLPKHQKYAGSNPRQRRVARVEKYRDEEGVIREAFAFGDSDKNLLVWYSLEAFRAQFYNWIEPNPRRPPY